MSTQSATSVQRVYPYAEIAARDKLNLDIFWLRDETWKTPHAHQIDAQNIETAKKAPSNPR